MAGGSSRRYPPELRERVVRMVAEISGQRDSEWAAISEVARLLWVGCAETVRKWVRQAHVRAAHRVGALAIPRRRRADVTEGIRTGTGPPRSSGWRCCPWQAVAEGDRPTREGGVGRR
jgi:transposase